MTPALRPEFRFLIDTAKPGSRVLDVGCNDGTLLWALQNEKNVDAHGIELRLDRAATAVARGLSVVHGDAEEHIAQYPDQAFDRVILSQTLPAMRDPKAMLMQLMRVGREAAVSIPNFGYYKVRLHLMLHGTMPVTRALDAPWHATENIHLCTVRDFRALCAACGIRIRAGYAIEATRVRPLPLTGGNLTAVQALFILSW